MKDIRLDLRLFSDGGDTSGCAAEQSSENSAENAPLSAENTGIAAPATDAPSPAADSPVPPSRERTDVELIAEALGVEAFDRDALLDLIRSRRERNEFFSILRERAAMREYKKLSSEAERLTSSFPGFDLKKELSDRRFASMVNSGLSIEEAFRAVHFDELMENAVNEAQNRAMKALSEFSSRPDENGSEGHAPAHTAPDVGSLTGKGIRDILRRVEKGAKVKF